MTRLLAALLSALIMPSASAMMIDKMELIAKGDNNNFYTLTNNTEIPMFITTQVTELDISTKGIVETPYTAKNIADWKINVNPAKFVLMPNQSTIAYVNVNKCADGKACQRNKDAVFNIGFVPQPYTKVLNRATSV